MSRPRIARGALCALTGTALVLSGATAAVAATTARPAAIRLPAHALTGTLGAEVQARSQAMATGKPVVVGAMTTATSITTANANGTLTTVSSTQPTRMRTAAGAWVGLDAGLRRAADGSVRMTASTSSLELSGGGRGALVREAAGGDTLALTLPVALPAPVLQGDTATYRSIEPGLDLVLTVQANGSFREVFVAHDAAAVKEIGSLPFATGLKGLTLKQDAAGNLAAVDSRTGAVVLNAPAASAWDSATNAAPSANAPEAGGPLAANSSAAGPARRAHVVKLPVTSAGGALTVHPDLSDLGAAPAQFPEYIDPGFSQPTTGAIMNWTEVQAASACQSYNNYDSDISLGVGNVETRTSCPGAYRSFFQDSLGGLDSADDVLSSMINISEVGSSQNGCGISEPIDVYWTSTIPDPSGWNAKPGQISDLLNTTVSTDGGGSCGAYPYQWDITGMIKTLAQENATNLTWGLYGNEGTADTLVRFNDNPSIVTTYDVTPGVPGTTATSPTPVTATGTAQPCTGSSVGYLPLVNNGGNEQATLSANVQDAIAGAPLQGVFTLTDLTASTSTTLTSSGTANSGATVQVTTPNLVDGDAYSWTAVATDGTLTSNPSSACTFTVQDNPPSAPAFSSTDFPPSGGSAVSGKRYGQAGNNGGVINLSATDPTGTVAGFYYNVGSPVPSGGGTYAAALNGAAPVTVTPGNWGTTTVYAQAVDSAGNRSASNSYSFFLPWYQLSKVVPGDVDGDGTADLVTADASGNLLLHSGDSDPAAAPTVLSNATQSPDGSTGWNKYLVTHYGSYVSRPVDDLWAFDTANNNLYLYKNIGTNPFQNTQNFVNVTKSAVQLAGGCAATTTADCSGYDSTDWKNVSQIVSVGDFYAGSSRDTSAGNYDVVTVEGDSLWLYQGKLGPNFLEHPIKLGTTGWSAVTVIGPGTVGGHPALWARDNATGVVTQYPIYLDSAGYPQSLGAAGSGGATIATGLTAAAYPAVVSNGDQLGNGNADLYATDASGNLWFYPGTASGALVAPTHQYKLTENTGDTIDDSAGTGALNGTISDTGATWGTRSTGGTSSQPDLSLDGNSGYAETNGNAVNTGGSFTVGAWAELTTLPTGNATVLSEFGTQNSPFYLQYNANGCWALVISNNDTATPTLNGAGGPTTVAAKTWYHIVGVYNATTQTADIYVNGQLAGTQSALPTFSTTGNLDIGRDLYTGAQVDYFPGQISDVQTWNSALTTTQVAALDAPQTLGTATLAGPLDNA